MTTLEDYEDWYQAGAIGKRKVKAKTSVYDLDQVNIEHIYPQNPQQLDAALDPVKHELGNLTALDDHDGMVAGNELFVTKQPIYAASQFAITKPLGQSPSTWNQAAVAARVTFYTDRAKTIFVVE